jgi:capsular polysaccharide biosynthesis protein
VGVEPGMDSSDESGPGEPSTDTSRRRLLAERVDRQSVLIGLTVTIIVAAVGILLLGFPARTYTATASLVVLPNSTLTPTDAAGLYDQLGNQVVATFAQVVQATDGTPAAAESGAQVAVTPLPETTLISIVATSPDPQVAVSVADRVATAGVGTLQRLNTPYTTALLSPSAPTLAPTPGTNPGTTIAVVVVIALLAGAATQQAAWLLARTELRSRSRSAAPAAPRPNERPDAQRPQAAPPPGGIPSGAPPSGPVPRPGYAGPGGPGPGGPGYAGPGPQRTPPFSPPSGPLVAMAPRSEPPAPWVPPAPGGRAGRPNGTPHTGAHAAVPSTEDETAEDEAVTGSTETESAVESRPTTPDTTADTADTTETAEQPDTAGAATPEEAAESSDDLDAVTSTVPATPRVPAPSGPVDEPVDGPVNGPVDDPDAAPDDAEDPPTVAVSPGEAVQGGSGSSGGRRPSPRPRSNSVATR